MCDIGEHQCIGCKKFYECTVPNPYCSTINGDEDGNLCKECLDKFASGYKEDEGEKVN